MANQPLRNFLKPFFDIFKAPASVKVKMTPGGYYAGEHSVTLTRENPWINNPWGVYGVANLGRGHLFSPAGTFVDRSNKWLLPGQSYNVFTGQLSDPKLAKGTAKLLNEAVNQRAINEAGLSAASRTSAREAPSVLATIDQMYVGAYLSDEPNKAKPISSLAASNAVGLVDRPTILGEKAKKQTQPMKPPAKRALT